MRPPSAALPGLLLAAGCYGGAADSSASGSSGALATDDPTTAGPTTADPPTDPTTADPTTSSSSTGDDPDSDTGDSTGGPPAPQPGLRGEYYATYLDLALERVDARLDFTWADAAPGAGLGVDRFSARWTGQLVPAQTGPHTLILDTDDGVRVWLGDQLVIDDWHGHFVTRNEALVELVAGVPVDLRVEYFELDLDASARLSWSGPSLPEQVIPDTALRAAPAASGLPPPKPPYQNPVESFDCPDPGVLAVDAPDGPNFYKVCTGGPFPIRRSRDLVLWSDTGAVVLPNGKPAWAANGNRNWAPELHRVGAGFIVYFTTVNGANVLSIGAAHAADPLGPWSETGGPLVEHPLGVIDATYLEVEGAPHLIYKIDGNSQGKPTPILIQALAPDGLALADGSAGAQILVNDAGTWEGGVVEAPWIVQRDSFYYMFYSGNVYDHRYRTGVARAASPLGPYEKFGAPILANNERWVGPGHGSLITVEGLDYFVYHAWPNAGDGTQDGAKGRHVLVDRVAWDDGWPRIHDGTPSRTQQPWPGVP